MLMQHKLNVNANCLLHRPSFLHIKTANYSIIRDKDVEEGSLLYFEEFQVGDLFSLDPVTLTEEEIYEFAEKFDPQPIHVDTQFAEQSIFKGIIASGLHTMSAVWGQWIRANKFGTEIIGGIGLDFMKWVSPVRPNDQLQTVAEIVEKIPSSKGGKGLLVIKFTADNQNGQVVLETQARVFVKSKN
jgi:acyl dehydratase